MNTPEFIVKRHMLRIDVYPFYRCSCGYCVMIMINPNEIIEKTIAEPEKPLLDYLPCGHAACCRMENPDGRVWCTHCAA